MLLKHMVVAKKKSVVTAHTDTSINKAMELMLKNNIGCLPVTDKDGKLLGIVSERDVLSRINKAKDKYTELKVGDIMTTKLIKGTAEDDISHIAEIMEKNKIRHLPIVKDEKVTGLVSLWEIYRTRMNNMEVENRQLTHMLSSRDKTGIYDDHY